MEQLRIEPGEVTPDSGLLDDLGADSLILGELIMALEESLIWKFPMRRLKRSQRLGMWWNILRLIHNLFCNYQGFPNHGEPIYRVQ